MSNTATIELVRKAYDLKLENVHILDKYSITEIGKIYNGIGPDRFPAAIRQMLNTLHPTGRKQNRMKATMDKKTQIDNPGYIKPFKKEDYQCK